MMAHPSLLKERLLVGELGSVYSYTKKNEVISDYYLNVGNHSMIQFLLEHGLEE